MTVTDSESVAVTGSVTVPVTASESVAVTDAVPVAVFVADADPAAVPVPVAAAVVGHGNGNGYGHGGRYTHAMPHAEWGADPEFFGPRHAHREGRIRSALRRADPGPGPHLECAAGVGSLSRSLATAGRLVVAVDTSLRSLAWTMKQPPPGTAAGRVIAVMADIGQLPFADGTFTSATSAETLEHIPDDTAAVTELTRCLRPGAPLVGTVPAGPEQWSDWDDWAGHERRYTVDGMARLLRSAGLEPDVRRWGWPLLRLYDDVFLKRVNRRRLQSSGGVDDDPTLRTVQGLGRRRWLVRAVRTALALDRVFDGAPWGVGLLFVGRRPVDGS